MYNFTLHYENIKQETGDKVRETTWWRVLSCIYTQVVQHTEVCVIEGGWGNFIWYINPLHPHISMYILHTVLCMFSKVLTRGIWLAI